MCEAWFDTEVVAPGLFRISEPHADPLIRANAWLQLGSDQDLLVDSGNGFAGLRPLVDRLRPTPAKPLVAFATHCHQDHSGGWHEFDERWVHPADAAATAQPGRLLFASDIGESTRALVRKSGGAVPEVLLRAVPRAEFDPTMYRPTEGQPTRRVTEGSMIDLGDHRFEVLHLPGHTPGSAGLWEAATGTFFSGDVVYATDPLIDTTPTSSVPDYLATMRRLLQLPVRKVRPGHDYSFGRELLVQRCTEYIAWRSEAAGSTP